MRYLWRMPIHSVFLAAVIAAAPLVAVLPATAADTAKPAAAPAKVTSLGGGAGWDAYADDTPRGKICYLIGKPKKSEPAEKRERVQLSVTHRPGDHVENVVNFALGYRAKEGSDAALEIGAKKFALFTDKDGAWARDAATDAAVVAALAKAGAAVLKATPGKGAATTDHYEMKGFAAALALIDKACGVKR